MRMKWGFAVLCVCAFVVQGCGSSGRTGPVPAYKVHGKVTFGGNPVVGADITFFSENADRSAFGRTNDRGEYQLTTFSANDGAVEGKHAVTIAKVELAPVVSPVADIESAEYEPPGFNESTDPPPLKSTLPEHYASQATSGLIAVVNPNDENEINFELTE